MYDEPETVASSDPALLALGVRYFNVRMSDSLTEFRCADRARISLASVLRLSDGTVLTTEEPSGTVNYGIPGTVGADIVDLVCARGTLMP